MKRTPRFLAGIAALIAAAIAPAAATQASDTGTEAVESGTTSFLVLYADDASAESAHAAIAAAGGEITSENTTIGLAQVTSHNADFVRDVRAQAAVKGAARDRSIGATQPGRGYKFADERLQEERAQKRPHSGGPAVKPAPGTDALSGYQWDMEMIGVVDDDGERALSERGAGVLVGVIDTGIDGSHPDIAPNFSNALSRNFTTDMSPARSPRRRTVSASRVSPRRPRSSTSAPVRTRATSSSARRSTP
jgi:subtilisin family serine protease